MRSSLLVLAAALMLFTGCAGATDSKPSIPVTLSGTGMYAVGQTVTLTANANYSGKGSLSYTFVIGGTSISTAAKNQFAFDLTASSPGAAAGASSIAVSVTVTDGTLTGTASGTVSY